jgi:hypothetical protein
MEESKGKRKSRKGNGRVEREMEESKGKWKSQNGNGRVEKVNGVEVELVKWNTWIK